MGARHKAENHKAENQKAEQIRPKVKRPKSQKAVKLKGRKSKGRKSKGRKIKRSKIENNLLTISLINNYGVYSKLYYDYFDFLAATAFPNVEGCRPTSGNIEDKCNESVTAKNVG